MVEWSWLFSLAIKNPKIIKDAAQHFGSQCIVVAIDVKREGDDWLVFSHGGTVSTKINALEWAKEVEYLGAGEILLTSMDRDGTKKGFDLEILKKILPSPFLLFKGIRISHHIDFYKILHIHLPDLKLSNTA